MHKYHNKYSYLLAPFVWQHLTFILIESLLRVQMNQKVMTYLFKNDYYLKANVYDKVTMHFFPLGFFFN